MAFGGGTFTEQNKILPGAYFKASSQASTATSYATVGIVGLIVPSNWSDGKVMHFVRPDLAFKYKDAAVWPDDAQNVLAYSPYALTPDKYTGEADLPKYLPAFLNDIFLHAVECYVYPIMGTAKVKAKCTLATATKYGTRGNDLSIKVVAKDATFEVTTLLGDQVVDVQVVAKAQDLKDNAFVVFDKAQQLTANPGLKLTGGVDGAVDKKDVLLGIERLGSYDINAICPMVKATDTSIVDAVIAQGEKYGHWMQMIGGHAAGTVPEGGSEYLTSPDVANETVHLELLYPWLAGRSAACEPGKSLDNKKIDSKLLPYLVDVEGMESPSQKQLEQGMMQGHMMLHTVAGEWRILNDNNTYTAFPAPNEPAPLDSKDQTFSYNQAIRTLHFIFTDWARIFENEFAGIAGTEEADRVNYKTRLVNNANFYAGQGALKNFDSADILVNQGKTADSYYVEAFLQTNLCVRKVYHAVTVSRFSN